jgi:hypothetical protein
MELAVLRPGGDVRDERLGCDHPDRWLAVLRVAVGL